MYFDLSNLSYNGKNLCVEVNKDKLTDFAFYVLLGGKKLDIKWYSLENVSILDILLLENKVYSLILFFRPKSEETTEEEKIVRKIFFKIRDKKIDIISENVLFESKNIKITEYDQKSDITFVTFNSAYTNKSSNPFGGDFILSEDWNLISVHKDNRNAYQDLSLEIFEEYVKPLILYKKTYVYGTSLGGYSSIYFGGVLDATIIAGAPMLSLISKTDHERYRDIEYKHIPIKATKKTSKPVYIIYDPLEKGDINFIKTQVLPAYPLLYLIPVKGGTHLVMEALMKKGILKNTIRDLVNENSLDAINRIVLTMDSQTRPIDNL